MEKRVYLNEMPTGTQCVIDRVHGHGGFRHRVSELGFVHNTVIRVVKNAPLLDPVEYEILGNHISLRRSEAKNIEVVPLDATYHSDFTTGTIEEHVQHEVQERQHELYVALVGNPNCGKTTFFNLVTGRSERIGNYSGVTVEAKEGVCHYGDYTIHLVDLPGTYSLSGFSPEGRYVMDYLIEQKPDVVLNVADATHIERNLFLTTQLIDLNPRMVLALNMFDELEKRHATLDYVQLRQLFGFPILPLSATKGDGINDIWESVISVYENTARVKHIHINYGEMVETAIDAIKKMVYETNQMHDIYPGRYIAIQLLDGDKKTLQTISDLPNHEDIEREVQSWRSKLEAEYHDHINSILSEIKYGFIRGALRETLVVQESSETKGQLSYAADNFLTNRWLGMPILFSFLWVTFQITFSVGGFFQHLLQRLIDLTHNGLDSILTAGMLKDLLLGGVLPGVGGVLVFLPNILILFLFISVFEDTGYMARVAFLMDKIMHRIGLHGKAFIPYVIGMGCTVPAVMGTRILENPKDRILTAITVPFISCSTRFSVYILFVGTFFHAYQGLILLAIYLFGVMMAIGTSLLLNKVVFNNESDSFVMELPPYRMPSWKNIWGHVWNKVGQYIKKMGTVILLASIIIWALSYFPHGSDVTGIEQIEQSYLGQLGQLIQPVFNTMGLTWKESVALLTGFSAKEIIITTMNILYGGDISMSHLNGLSCISILLFILLYSPCVAAVVSIAKETKVKWAVFSVIYSTTVAWLVATVFYQVMRLF